MCCIVDNGYCKVIKPCCFGEVNMNEYKVTRVITIAEEVFVMANSKEEAEENIEKFEDGMDWLQLNKAATYDVKVT